MQRSLLRRFVLAITSLACIAAIAAPLPAAADDTPGDRGVEAADIEASVVNGYVVDDVAGELSTVRLFNVADGFPFCSGVVISPRHVLTAAHCVWDDDGARPRAAQTLGVAEPTAYDGETTSYAFSAAVDIAVHPAWRGTIADLNTVDLAVIEVDRDLVTPPRGLMSSGYAPEHFEHLRFGWGDRVDAIASGWGLTQRAPEPIQTAELRAADMEVYTTMADGRCADGLILGYDDSWPNLLCGPAQGAAICNGDSGGPLWVRDAAGTLRVQGIASFVKIPCDDNVYWVNITQFIGWITAQTDGMMPSTVPSAPVDLQTISDDGEVVVSWANAADGGSPISHYEVTVHPLGEQFEIPAGEGGTYRLTLRGALNGLRLNIEVRAVNALGAGGSAWQDFEMLSRHAGYWLVDGSSRAYAFGDAATSPVYQKGGSNRGATVAVAAGVDGQGYYVLRDTGEVIPHGDLTWYGDLRTRPDEQGGRPASIAVTPTGRGYWVFTDTGAARPFGDARFFGDMNDVALNAPIVGSVATPSGNGYYMVAADGGVFTFGDARFHGSTGDLQLAEPVVGMIPNSTGGYWLIAADGGVFSFGAPYRGSVPDVLRGAALNRPVIGGVAYGNGYLLFAADGGVFTFSDLPFEGSLGATDLPADIVAIAAFSNS